MLASGAILLATTQFLPNLVQADFGYTATWAGLVAAPSGVTAVLVAPFVGRYIGKYDARGFATASFVIFGISYFMRAGRFWSCRLSF